AESKPCHERYEWKHPNHKAESLCGRRKQNPFAIFRHEVASYLSRRLAGLKLLADDSLHLLSHLRRGIGDRKILTDDTTQFGRDGACSVIQLRRSGSKDRRCEEKQTDD